MRQRHYIHQIYYDEASRRAVNPLFIPLDNSANERSDWYEFWVIKNYLENNTLDPDAWYGFLSPKFEQKTGMDAPSLYYLLNEIYGSTSEVFLVPAYWENIAVFKNAFYQGDFVHPGLLATAQKFMDFIGRPEPPSDLISHTGNFTFCNFIVARPSYWKDWLTLAQKFFDVTENDPGALGHELRSMTKYKPDTGRLPIKTFIQERFPAIILNEDKWRSACASVPTSTFIDHVVKHKRYDLNVLSVVDTCNSLKMMYDTKRDPTYLQIYDQLAPVAQAIWLQQAARLAAKRA